MKTGLDIIIIIGAVTLGLIVGIITFILLSKKQRGNNESVEGMISKLSIEALDKNSQRFLLMAKEVLQGQKNEMAIDLDGKKNAINNLIDEIRKDLKKNEEKLIKTEEERIKSFSTLQTELESYKKITGELKISTDKLKNLLSNNQMRGAFGEQIAENLLEMAGFVIGKDFSRNETQATQDTRPDFTIFLPDRTKINIDVKFPYNSLVKSLEAENNADKKRHFLTFKQDVKNKIKQVCTRDYINPEENTVDFVILFIPNEMIFSYIYENMADVWEEAMKKKVVLAGPFSFTAILRMVKQAYSNFRYQKNIHHIIGLIQKFDDEYQKYSQSVDLLGDRIASASKQFDVVSTTRTRQLTGVVDKIKNQSALEKPEEDQIQITG